MRAGSLFVSKTPSALWSLTVGRLLPPGATRSRHRSRLTAPTAVAARVRHVSSRRPDVLRARQGRDLGRVVEAQGVRRARRSSMDRLSLWRSRRAAADSFCSSRASCACSIVRRLVERHLLSSMSCWHTPPSLRDQVAGARRPTDRPPRPSVPDTSSRRQGAYATQAAPLCGRRPRGTRTRTRSPLGHSP